MRRYKIFLCFVALLFLTPALHATDTGWLSSDWSVHREEGPAPKIELVRAAGALSEVIMVTKRGEVFKVPYEPEIASQLEGYNRLGSRDLEAFHRNRQMFLEGLVTVLTRTRFFFGLGSLVRDQFTQIFRKSKNSSAQNPVEELASQMVNNGSIRSRSHWVIQNLITAMDQSLFQNAQLVAHQNEFSVSASVGIIAEAGVRRRGFGGSVGLGISLGYNKEKKAFVFEIYSEVERLSNAFTPTAMVGVVPRVGVNILSQVSGRELSARNGSTMYPPMSYVMAMPDIWSVGATTSLLSFPPLLPEFMVYGHSAQRKTLLRLTISPATRGWLRLNEGEFNRRFHWISQTVEGFLEAIRRVAPGPAPKCRDVLA